MAETGWQRVVGAAQRRRAWRLRSWYRHEQQTVRMALAAYTHHSAPRRPTMARAGGWERAVLHGQVLEHPTSQAAGTEYFSLDIEDVPAAGSRPERLAGVRPQERVQQHFVDQFVDTAPALPILDVPLPLMGEQLSDVLQFFDALMPVPEQVVEVPKILPEERPYAHHIARYAAGGTPGGSADDRILFFLAADYGAHRSHSSSWSWRANFQSSRFSYQTEFNSAAWFPGTQF